MRGDAIAKDVTRGVQLLNAVCTRGGARACKDLADLYDAGEGVPIDHKRAFDLLVAVCARENDDDSTAVADGCETVGIAWNATRSPTRRPVTTGTAPSA